MLFAPFAAMMLVMYDNASLNQRIRAPGASVAHSKLSSGPRPGVGGP